MRHVLPALLLLALAAPAALSAADVPTKDSLKTAFAGREAAVAAAKAVGTIGETTTGVLAVPPGATPDAATSDLLAKENADRQELFKLLAAETGTTAQVVAERYAMRLYQGAPAGTWLQKRDGAWAKK